MRRTQRDGTSGWIVRLLAGTVLAIGMFAALAATAGAQTPGGDSDSDHGAAGGGGSDSAEDAAFAACVRRYRGYQAGWAEQTCRYPTLVWRRTNTCVVNQVYSDRATGRIRVDAGGLTWNQREKIADYACTVDWAWSTTDGGPPPILESEMIKPHAPTTRIGRKYRTMYWIAGAGAVSLTQIESTQVVPGSSAGGGGSGSASASDGGSISGS